MSLRSRVSPTRSDRALNRRRFLQAAASVAACPLSASAVGWDFFFTRLMYESGNWNVDQRMPNNVLNSLVEYTTLNVDPVERVIPLSDEAMLDSPFCYLSGHKLVQFTETEARHFKRYVENGGFVFVDDCNHDIDALFAVSFTRQMQALFGEDCLAKLPDTHPLYRSFFDFDTPPTTSFELNGWGDDLVHDYLRGIDIDGRTAVLYSNKDYGCEWDYDYRNKRWLAVDNTRFAVNIVMYALNY
ncbi:MAG: DUF4159 domain-containing protein [Pseudomonadota bacterium]